MKKVIYTLAFVSLISIASRAQEPKKEKKQEPVKTVNVDGTVTEATVTAEPTKKSGTRMAINEKGLPGSKTTNQNNTKESTKDSPKSQPGATKD